MDLVIQIIIILAIIAMVMKRFREISEKSKDLEKTSLPKPLADMYDLEDQEKEPEKRPKRIPLQEVMKSKLPEPVKIPEVRDEDTFESLSDIEMAKLRLRERMAKAEETMSEIRTISDKAGMVVSYSEKRPRIPVIRFGQNQLIRGIIMSEILSPPKGLRDRWGQV